MSEPVFDKATEDIYASLPEHYRRSDKATDYTTKKFINVIGKQLQGVQTLVDRFTYDSPEDNVENPHTTSDLINPLKADEDWIPWLGVLFGSRVLGRSERFRRELAPDASGYNGGTIPAMVAAARTALIGDKFCAIYKHSTASGPGTGGQWDMLVVTLSSETLKNKMPFGVATMANPRDWTGKYQANGGALTDLDNYIRSFPEYTFDQLWEQHALIYKPTNSTSTQPHTFTVDGNYKVPTGAGDPNQVMISAWIPTLANGVTKSMQAQLIYYNSSDAVLATNYSSFDVSNVKTQFNTARVNAPAGSTYYRMKLIISDLTKDDILALAQAGARNEAELPWINKTANPAQTIIDRGAKPAGIVLYSATFASSWNTVETALPTWNAWEAETWTEIEESSLHS